jgi:hypothetical protein
MTGIKAIIIWKLVGYITARNEAFVSLRDAAIVCPKNIFCNAWA